MRLPQTSEEQIGVEDLHHLLPVQLVGPVLVSHGVATPEDPALAQPLDEDALLAAVQENSPLQVPKELLGDLFLAVVLDGVGRGEPDVLQGVGGVELLPVARGLPQGDPAALRARGADVAHQPPAVVEADHHLGITWEVMDGNVWSGKDGAVPRCRAQISNFLGDFKVSWLSLGGGTSSPSLVQGWPASESSQY